MARTSSKRKFWQWRCRLLSSLLILLLPWLRIISRSSSQLIKLLSGVTLSGETHLEAAEGDHTAGEIVNLVHRQCKVQWVISSRKTHAKKCLHQRSSLRPHPCRCSWFIESNVVRKNRSKYNRRPHWVTHMPKKVPFEVVLRPHRCLHCVNCSATIWQYWHTFRRNIYTFHRTKSSLHCRETLKKTSSSFLTWFILDRAANVHCDRLQNSRRRLRYCNVTECTTYVSSLLLSLLSSLFLSSLLPVFSCQSRSRSWCCWFSCRRRVLERNHKKSLYRG